jgi:hypothetical protein
VSNDVNKLTNVRQVGDKTIAACPACREDQLDHRGEHLFISKLGKFGCVLHPGSSQDAHAHRRRIWKLAGAQTNIGTPRVPKRVMVQRPAVPAAEICVLGHFGRSPSSHAHACIGAVEPSLKSKEGASEPSETQFIELMIMAFGMFNACRFQFSDRNGRPSASGTTVTDLKRALSCNW